MAEITTESKEGGGGGGDEGAGGEVRRNEGKKGDIVSEKETRIDRAIERD